MNDKRPQPRATSTRGKSPAERSEEFLATQRRLKEEAAERRKQTESDRGKKRGR
jgi:hypothetical protein